MPWRRASSVGSGIFCTTNSIAEPSLNMPVGFPSASRSISPPVGFFVSGLISVRFKAREFATATCPEIWPDTKNPTGGEIERDAEGNPTGMFKEGSAMEFVVQKIPEPTDEARRRG